MNCSIEAIRFLFMCVICLWHCRTVAPFIHHGYIAVEFYFVLAGFFIYHSYTVHHELRVLDYAFKRIQKFAPPMIISILIIMAVDRKQYLYLSDFTADGIISKYYSHIHEFLFCSGLGITEVHGIGHNWFISVLVIGSTLLFSTLKNCGRKAISLYIPLFCIFSFSLILGNGTHAFENSTHIPGLYNYFIRGVAEMGLGIELSYLLHEKQSFFVEHKFLLIFFGSFCLFGFVLLFFSQGNYDYLALIFCPVIICCCFIPTSFLYRKTKKGILIWLGKHSMYMYFIHNFVSYMFFIYYSKIDQIPTFLSCLIYLCCVVFCSVILRYLSNLIVRFV